MIMANFPCDKEWTVIIKEIITLFLYWARFIIFPNEKQNYTDFLDTFYKIYVTQIKQLLPENHLQPLRVQ